MSGGWFAQIDLYREGTESGDGEAIWSGYLPSLPPDGVTLELRYKPMSRNAPLLVRVIGTHIIGRFDGPIDSAIVSVREDTHG